MIGNGDNEMIWGAVHRYPGICLTAEENPRKLQLGDRLMKGLCDQSSPQMGPLSTHEVNRIAQQVRKTEERNVLMMLIPQLQFPYELLKNMQIWILS